MNFSDQNQNPNPTLVPNLNNLLLSVPRKRKQASRQPYTVPPGTRMNHVNKAPSSLPVTKSKKKRSKYSDLSVQTVVPDVSDDIIVINRNTIAEAETALTAGFPSDTLTDEEIHAGVVSVVGGIEQINYVLIRNHIITKWRENVWNWVSKETFIKTVPPYCIKLLESAYNYLDSYGYINFGVANEIKEKVPVKPIKLRVVIIGAGFAGLAAARQLRRFGFHVIVLEGRKRAGGRVNTWQVEKGNKFAADLGGSVLTGTLGNPLCTLAKQLFLSLYKIRDKCPLYRQDGKPVDPDMDSKVEKRFNDLLDRTSTLRESMGKVSQNVSLASALDTYGAAENAEELNLFNWHLANLEFANAGLLSKLSLAFWDQDDMYDAGGEHCFLPGGVGKLVRALAEDIPILYEKNVNKIHYTDYGVQVFVGNQVFEGDMVLCTVPLGVLKSGNIEFIPDLPQRKIDGIKRLGFGLLNKVAMLFPDVFWDPDLDMFGHLKDDPSQRGEFFLFYNYSSVASGAVLIALVAGEAAFNFESMSESVVVSRVLQILKDIYEPQGITVPEPIQTVCTRWGSDPFSLGSYSNVAVGSSGDDYDILAENVGDGRVFFAGEATNKRYPATMHGAFLSGLREAANIARYAKNRSLKKRVEKKPARNPHSQASVLADLFREPDIEFGSYAIIYDKKNTDPKSLAVLRVTFSGLRKENNETNQKHSNKLLFQQLQSHLNQKQEFCIYTLLTRENALELWEVRGGDDMRMKFLTENLGVKLVGRKGLGPMADSVISSIKAERGTRKSGHTSSSLKSGLSKPKPATSKQNLVRRAKIMRKNNGAGFSGIGRGAKPVGTGGLSLSNQNVAAQVLTGAKTVGTDVVSLSSLNLSVGDQMLADDNLNRGNSVGSVSHITAGVKALDTDVVSPSNLNQNVEDQVPIEDQPSIPHITEEAKPVDSPNSGYNVYNNSCIAGGAEPMDTGAFPLSVFSQNPGGVFSQNPGGVILGDGNLSVGENGTSPLEAQPVGDVLINYVENQIMGCLLPPEVFIGSEIYSPNMDEGDIISGNSGSSTVAIDIPVEFVQGSVPLPCSYLEDSQMGEQPAGEASLSKSD